MLIPDELMFSWESQRRQFDNIRPDISSDGEGTYYIRIDKTIEENFDDDTWIDCLIRRDKDGRLVGILYHYPVELPLERSGNFNIWVDPRERRKGHGTALITEAVKRFKINFVRQRYSVTGKKFIDAWLKVH